MIRRSLRRLLACLALTIAGPLGTSLAAQQSPTRESPLLSVDRIFNSREFRGEGFGPVRWLDDSTYTAVEPSSSGKGADLVRYDAASGKKRVLVSAAQLTPPGAKEPLDIEDYEWSPAHDRLLVFTNSARVWRANSRGDFWVLDLTSGKLAKLGGAKAKPSSLQFAKFSPDGKRVAYVREHNIYVEQVLYHEVIALTADGSVTTINGTFDWVYEEELSMRDGFRWSPDGSKIAYWQLDARGVRDFLLINNTDSLYSFVKPVQYPKAGTTNSAARVGVVSAEGGATTWMKVPGDPRNNYLARMDWAGPSSADLTIQQLDRRQRQNTLWLATARTGAVQSVLVEKDSAWLDISDDHDDYGPGPSLHWITPQSFLWLSERDGWRHAYVVRRDGTATLVTKGSYDVMKVVRLDVSAGWLYYHASPLNGTQLFLFRTRLDGTGAPERITPVASRGRHDYDISTNGSWAIHSFSSWGTPTTVDLVRLPTHSVARTLVSNSALKARLSGLKQGPMEFFQVDVGNGVKLDGWMMKPADFDPNKKYPVLFYVYGEPASQTVTDAYGGSRWLWHLMLTQQGYIVASIDNRGTPSPRGRDFRKAVLNRIGALRVQEQSAAARALAQRSYVDSTRMGVWGWSGGGSSTLLLMFRAPDVYRMGMSVAPVADVHNYDTIYQERYVGLPTTDAAAYKDASAINFVNGLKGDLLVVHGSGDDNVHFQGTEQLINALVAANKPFSMMEYPNRTHGIYEGPGTTVHLYNLLTKYLREHLPAGGR